MDNMVGLLALFTLLAALLIAGGLYLRFLQNPKNRRQAQNVSEDRSSAHTAVRGGEAPPNMQDRS